MEAVFRSLFFPEKQTVIFAIKGVIAMAMSLTVSLMLNLDRPYWALVSAVFLQMRPETGLVVEKAICQIVGTIVGGLFGIFVLTQFMAYPYLALGILTCWLGLNSTLSVMVRRTNFIYAFAMAAATAVIVVLLVMVTPATANSQAVFNVAQARMSEIIIGSICAGVVSHLFWPVKVKDGLQRQARSAINQTLGYLVIELDKEGSHEGRHNRIDSIMLTLGGVSDDSSAVSYEGPKGPGRARAANQLCQKLLSLLALVQIFGRLQRQHAELMTPLLTQFLDELRDAFARIAESDDVEYCLEQVKILRKNVADYRANKVGDDPFEAHMLNIGSELTSELTILLRAFRALEKRDTTLLNEPRMQSYRDPLAGLITGVRTSVVFLIGACIWISTGSSAALMIMILPVIFSIMLARLPLMILKVVLKRLLVGVVAAILLAVFYALNILSQSSGQLEILVLVLAGPYFIGLLLLGERATLPYGLGLCIPFSILVSPSRNMSRAFSIDYTVSSALAIFTGVCILFWVFHLIRGPSIQLLVHRLFKTTYQDLLQLNQQVTPIPWYNRRMADRLLRLTTYDQGSESRAITDLALSGLNLGHVSVRLHSICENLAGRKLESLDHWQKTLADAFMMATKGKYNDDFRNTSDALYQELVAEVGPSSQVETIKGMFMRINLTFERSAKNISQQKG